MGRASGHQAMPFIGRNRELATLESAVESALDGRGSGVVVLGEAGIGKSCLLAAVTATAEERGAATYWASAWEPGSAPAHWHWIQVLRKLAAGLDRQDLVRDLGDDAEEVARLMPDLRSGVRLGRPDRPDIDDPRFRLYDSVASFLCRVARRHPFVLVLDDLHAADVGSLQLLRFVAVETRHARVALLAAGRAPEADPVAADIGSALADLGRSVDLVRLGGLGGAEIEELLRHLLGEQRAARLAEEIHHRSGGNPLFATELGRLVATSPRSHATLPVSIRSVIEHRLDAIAPESLALLRLAAAVGEEFTLPLVEAAAGASRRELLDAVDDGVRGRLLRDVGGQRFAFTHALVREVLYEQLPVGARTRAHRDIAEAIEATGDVDARIAELAHHFVAGTAALEDGKAADYAERAGNRAVEQFAYEDAVNHFRSALDVSDATRLDESRRIALMLALGEATLRSGDMSAARDVFVEAAGRARIQGRADLLARAAMGLGSGLDGFEVRLFDHAQIALLEDALAAIGPAPSPLRSSLLARLSVALTFAAPIERRLQLAEQAIAMARDVGDPHALAYALAARCDATAGPDSVGDRMAVAAEITQLARSGRDLGTELLGRRNRVIALLESGDMTGVDAEVNRYASAADASRQPLYQWYVPLWRGMRALMEGRLGDARAHRDEAAAVGARAQSQNAVLNADVLAWNTLLVAGRHEEAAARLAAQLELADGFYAEHFWVALVTPALHQREAKATLDRFAAEEFVSFPRDAIWLACMKALADSCGVVDHQPAAEQLYELIVPFRACFAVDGIGATCYGSMARPLGVLARVLGRRTIAIGHFDEALDAHRSSGATALVAETMHDLGMSLRAFGDDGDGDRLLREAELLRSSLGVAPHRATAAASQGLSPAAEASVFRLEGTFWTLTYRGRTARVASAKGLHDIATLLARPSHDVHVADLIGMVHTGPDDPILDERARAEYRARLGELREELDDAEADADIGRADAARVAMDLIASELASAFGLGGRPRSHIDPAERARKAVTQRIRNAIKRVAEVHPQLATHLDRSVSTGRFCRYDPEHPVDWTL